MTRQPTTQHHRDSTTTRDAASDPNRADDSARGVAPVARASAATPPAIHIERLIMHHLDHRLGRCELVDDEATLDGESEQFFTGHVLSASDRADWRARFREGDNALPEHLTGLLGDSGAFIAASRALAQRLYDFMKLRAGQIVPGDFVVIAYTTTVAAGAGDATGAAERHVALLKMDPDQQRLTRAFHRVDGHMHVSIQRAANILPEARGLQKCALISARAGRAGARHFTVRLLDTQAGPRSDGVAAFFYRDFLAATLAASARRQTRLFLSESSAWLQGLASQMTLRDLLGFYAARREALTGERVDLRDFAARALPGRPEAVEALVTRLTGALFNVEDDGDSGEFGESGDGPKQTEAASNGIGDHPFFPVDRAVAKKYIEKVTIELDGGARLSVPAARFASLARVLDERDAEGKAQVILSSLIFREVNE